MAKEIWFNEYTRDRYGRELVPYDSHYEISFDQVKEILSNRQKMLSPYDRIFNLTDFRSRFYGNKHYLISEHNKDKYVLTKNAEYQLLKIIKWTDTYFYELLSNSLKSQIINYAINNLLNSENLRLFRIVNQNVCRAILSKNYRKFDDFEIIDTIEPFLKKKENIRFSLVEFFEDSTHFRIIFDQKKPITVGDEVAQGIHIRNSEVGQGSVNFKSVIYRLVCSNGMTMPKDIVNRVEARHQTKQETTIKNISKFMNECFGSLDIVAGAFKKSKDEKFDNLESVMGMLCDNYSILKDHYKDIASYIKYNNRFELVNGITEYAKEHKGDIRTELEDIAGEVLFQSYDKFNREVVNWAKKNVGKTLDLPVVQQSLF